MSTILRFATAGSVDDGKSSLIGRLLYDSKSIFEDQLEAIERASERRGSEGVELALLTDGLRAEREQNITIDVAYRYFSTPRRKFIIADTPGHFQYTRNMVTGTSTVDLSVILVDARKGVLPQSKRHAAVSALLGVPEVVVAVNKMDLVEFSEDRFDEIRAEFGDVAAKLGIRSVTFVPISALLGDNVVEPSANMPWYGGPTLLSLLEEIEIPESPAAISLRLPVQVVIRPNQDYRGLAGQVEAGEVGIGDPVLILPSGRTSTIASVRGQDGETDRVGRGKPVVVTLTEDIDASRGDMLVDPLSPPTVTDRFEAVVCWMAEDELRPGDRYVLLHNSQRVFAHVERVLDRLDIESLDPQPSRSLALNDLGHVVVRSAKPIFADRYQDNRTTGSFALVDVGTNRTVAAGMIRAVAAAGVSATSDSGLAVWVSRPNEPDASRAAAELAREARSRGLHVVLLEESEMRAGLNADLPDRAEGLRRLREVAMTLKRQGYVAILAAFVDESESAGIEGVDRWVRQEDVASVAETLFGSVGGL